MTEKFKLCILFEEKPGRDLSKISQGWEMAEIPVALMVKPFESAANWSQQRKVIESWNLPPIKVASHFLQFWGLKPTGPGVDWDQLDFWTGRAFARLAGLGVEVTGVYGGFFRYVEGFSKTKAMDQAIRFVDRMADYAEKYDMLVALEPIAELDTLWPMYVDGLKFAKEEVARPSVRVMADIDYFFKGNQPFELIAEDPEYCLHVHIAGDHAQPGVGDMDDVFLNLFNILRDIGYTRGVSAACGWVSTDGSDKVDFGKENAKSLAYLKALRDQVYAE
ncbi:MAG: sugar phosphate isomerase/epimerase [Anaerolineae bacterium]|nr:sugar phosphate isomerase/epimerase [Anaerolineae bacterium]